MHKFDGYYFMERAIQLAQEATKQGEVPVGAVIVHQQSKTIIAQAHNLVETHNDPTAHAEILAIKQAMSNNNRLNECDIYVTLEPCPMCAQALSFARIRRIFFASLDQKGGGVINGARIFDASSCHHKPEIYPEVSHVSQATLLLKEFFQHLRR
jgi:tRNA(Arg) A34 adenosine deaminase TadA